ncbi:hypothetical protein [Streptococcus sciuri]|uniref:hypothetical protein n=1 Tax=Streptococcus sciuri TaxID=2973939 RepID=UPI0040329E1B
MLFWRVPDLLIAFSKKRENNGWKSTFDDIDKIIERAWTWYFNLPNGYDTKE